MYFCNLVDYGCKGRENEWGCIRWRLSAHPFTQSLSFRKCQGTKEKRRKKTIPLVGKDENRC